MIRSALVVMLLSIGLVAPGVLSAAALQDAAKAGDLERVGRLIDEGANLNARAGFGTALHWAILNGHEDVAELLVARGADVNASTALGTPLHAAAAAGRPQMALLLLEQGADVDAGRGDGFTPLHVAAQQGDAEVVRELLEHGADADALASNGSGDFGPLHLAELGGHTEAAQALRAAGGAAPPEEPIAALMAEASAPRGREAAISFRCGLCHVLEAGQPPPISGPRGPDLGGVVGRLVASVPGFDYSDALKRWGGIWTVERINAFISHPMITVPGTKMDMQAGGNLQQRADLIAYLATLGGRPR